MGERGGRGHPLAAGDGEGSGVRGGGLGGDTPLALAHRAVAEVHEGEAALLLHGRVGFMQRERLEHEVHPARLHDLVLP